MATWLADARASNRDEPKCSGGLRLGVIPAAETQLVALPIEQRDSREFGNREADRVECSQSVGVDDLGSPPFDDVPGFELAQSTVRNGTTPHTHASVTQFTEP